MLACGPILKPTAIHLFTLIITAIINTITKDATSSTTNDNAKCI